MVCSVNQRRQALSEARQSIIFNRHRLPRDADLGVLGIGQPDEALNLEDDDPVVHLGLSESGPPRIKSIPPGVRFRVNNPLFGSSLDWVYRGYIVHRLPATGAGAQEDEQGRDGAPPQPIPSSAEQAGGDAAPQADYIYLFNVVVALEWRPSTDDLRELEWAFRRASDFLYDVSDGWMAFGQVIFGGPELMVCADVQVMASNRLLARSWVGALHEPLKHIPIRLGRGVWHELHQVSIPWDEPEAYRMLVHEWGHYALHLRDAYREPRRVTAAGEGNSQILVQANPGEPAPYTLVVLKNSLVSESIMATLEGTSELAHRDDRTPDGDYEWETIIKTGRYPRIEERRSLEGPGRLPLPLPVFGYQQQPAPAGQIYFPPRAKAFAIFDQLPQGVEFARCWIYVLKGMTQDRPYPDQVIAQGTLDARSSYKPFRLLGAEPGDTVVVVAGHGSRPPVVLRGAVTEEGRIEDWRLATPDAFPMVDVLPAPVADSYKRVKISVRIRSAAGRPPRRALVFPLGQMPDQQPIDLEWPDRPDWTSPPQFVPTLDGHVLLLWDEQLLISSFSQGGGPGSSVPAGGPPITAGSSDGHAMLFFQDDPMAEAGADAPIEDYSRIKVVTTMAHGMAHRPTYRALSHAYSATCWRVIS
jgi:hypothetical protein